MDRAELPDSISAGPKVPVDKTFRPFNPDQVLLLPASLDDWLPAEHLARFVAELVDEHPGQEVASELPLRHASVALSLLADSRAGGPARSPVAR